MDFSKSHQRHVIYCLKSLALTKPVPGSRKTIFNTTASLTQNGQGTNSTRCIFIQVVRRSASDGNAHRRPIANNLNQRNPQGLRV